MEKGRVPLVLILAGGQGERLYPLTKHRSKPAVPFGASYRIIDFTLSNCINSGYFQIFPLVQYKSLSLSRHFREAWSFLSPEMGQFIQSVPPQLRTGKVWYEGTAHAVYQNVYLLQEARPAQVLVLSGDHIYRMDYRGLMARHREVEADLTIATFAVAPPDARRMGVLQVDGDGRVQGFLEKPASPQPAPGMGGMCLANMGVYAFRTDVLVRAVTQDSKRHSTHDFGRDVIPDLVGSGARVFTYRMPSAPGDAEAYWMDIGTLDAYWEASMSLLPGSERFPLRNDEWPLRPRVPVERPALIAGADVRQSLVAAGAEIRGGRVRRSILSTGVVVEPGAEVVESILMHGVRIGRGARVVRAIVDKDVAVPPRFHLGGEAADPARFAVSEEGLTAVPKREHIPY